MQTRFILGPAGSGKTFRCLEEIRAALAAAPDGPPLVLITPKQTTYQAERQLLAAASLPGYTRLHILSFDRLASFIFKRLQKPPPRMLDEEGRLMVLRGLLAKKRDELKLFRASARLTGFAQQLSLVLRELQRQQLTPDSLAQLAEHCRDVPNLSFKLQDLARLLGDYLDWLRNHELQDAEFLLDFATQTLRAPHAPLALGELWVDGFTEMSPQELDLLAEVLPQTERATMTFCLDRIPTENISWLSNWSAVRQMYHRCHKRIAALPNCEVSHELLPRHSTKNRFSDNAILAHLEAHWNEPVPLNNVETPFLRSTLRIATCADPEAEAMLAAREILRFVRAGGRFREITVLARDLKSYHEPLVNIFNRYQIPIFLDRRESVSHHPLAELSRNALRAIAFSWARDDWFAALKTGLVPATEVEIDRLENEALARGWKGNTWLAPLMIPNEALLTEQLEPLRRRLIAPFEKLAGSLGTKPNGTQLATALRKFWDTLRVAEILEGWSKEENKPQPIHLTVWEQMNAWLDNVEMAFPTEPLSLREWLPILEAGLAGLTVGVIPPAVDQVSVGAIDRSRSAEIRLAIVLGMNESVFPAPPQASVLLTDDDRLALERQGLTLSTARQQLSRERFYGYVAFTRAQERLVLTLSQADASGNPLNLSPFIAPFQQLFPALEIEDFPRILDWRKSEHVNELVVPLLRQRIHPSDTALSGITELAGLPALTQIHERLSHLLPIPAVESLSPALAAQLYRPALRTSVSRMEQFAACPFKFLVHSGLRAEERKLFELDIREQGNFQHDVLAAFHESLGAKRWRDLLPAEARERIKQIAAGMLVSFREGLLQATEEGKFTARVLTESLQDFVETLVEWMRKQYAFDPVRVELPFDEKDPNFPPWELDLQQGHRLRLHGRIDRIDLYPSADGESALCVVVDYKSSQKQLDSLLMANGLQLQLPAYLNVLRHFKDPRPIFGVSRLQPAGVFYVNLRGKYERGENRDEALANVEAARKHAYRHAGRFDVETLDKLDDRNAAQGDQFNYRRNKDGSVSAASKEPMKHAEFMALLDNVETALKNMGCAIYAGAAHVDPYRKGSETACDQCDYRAICRIDPWTHSYRVLRKPEKENA